MAQLESTGPVSQPIAGLDPSLPHPGDTAELVRSWGPKVLMLAVLAAAVIAGYSMPAVDLAGGETLSLNEVTTKLTLQGKGWVFSLTWFAGVLAAICMLAFPPSERFARTISGSFFSIVAMAFPFYVNSRLAQIDEEATGLGSGLTWMWALLGVAALIPWVSVLWWNRMDPIFGRDWGKWLFILPAIVWILLLTIFPLVYAFTTSRYAFRNGRISRFVGWDNYKRLWDVESWGAAFTDALLFGAVAALIVAAVGIVFQWVGSQEYGWLSVRGLLGAVIGVATIAAAAQTVRLRNEDAWPWIVAMVVGAGLLLLDRRGFRGGEWRSIAGFIPVVAVPVALIAFLIDTLNDPLDTQLGYTVFFVVTATAVEMILGFLLALLMNRELRARGALRAIITLPLFAAPVGMGFLARTIFLEEGGPVNSVFEAIGIGGKPWISDPGWARITTVIVDVWQWVPFVFVIALAGLQSLPQDVIEASEVDGASDWQVFRYVTLPLMAPILWLILMLRAIDAFKVFDIAVSLTLGGPGRATEYYSLFNYRTARRFFNYGEAAVQAFLLLFIVSVIVTLLWGKIKGVYEEEVVRA